MHKLLIGICFSVAGAGVGAGALWLSVRDRLGTRPMDPPANAQEPATVPEEPPRLSHTAAGLTVVRLDTETQARVGLKAEPLLAATRQPEIATYGSLQEDPAHSFTLRAPVAGVLRAAEATNWPDLDQHLDTGVLVGYVEPRLTQTERIDLAARLTQARADAAGAAAALAVAQSSYENKRKLNAEDKAVSDRALEEAQAKVKSEEARLSAATQTVRLLESAELPADQRAARFELRTEQTGQVVESFTRPGEAVEAGQVLLRIVRFDTLLARVEVPIGEPYDESATIARIVVVGDEDRALTGERFGLGDQPRRHNARPHAALSRANCRFGDSPGRCDRGLRAGARRNALRRYDSPQCRDSAPWPAMGVCPGRRRIVRPPRTIRRGAHRRLVVRDLRLSPGRPCSNRRCPGAPLRGAQGPD